MTEAMEKVKDPNLPLTRNLVNRVAFNFLHMKFVPDLDLISPKATDRETTPKFTSKSPKNSFTPKSNKEKQDSGKSDKKPVKDDIPENDKGSAMR